MAAEAAKNTNIFICGQSVSWGKEGALTGEVSATMLAEAGCCYVIIGHSERRRLFHESDHDVAKKTLIALEAGLVPIVCLVETGEERDNGLSEGSPSPPIQRRSRCPAPQTVFSYPHPFATSSIAGKKSAPGT